LRAIASGELRLQDVEQLPRARARDVIGRSVLVAADLGAVGLAIWVVVTTNATRLTPWALGLPLLFFVLAKVAGLYDRDQSVLRKTTLDEAPTLLSVAAIYSVIADGAASIWSRGPVEPLVIWGTLAVGLVLARAVARFVEVRVSTPERVVVIGDATTTARIRRKFAYDGALNAVVTGRLSPEPDMERRADGLLGSLHDLPTVVSEHRVERLVVASAQLRRDDLLEVVRLAKACGVKVAVLPPLLEVIGSSVEFDDLGGQVLLSVRRFGLTRVSRVLKRTFDIVVAGVALVVLLPLMAAIAIAIKLSSRGSVVFRQTRIGRNGRDFQMLKFRTMVIGADERKHELLEYNEASPLFKIANDPRTTPLGRFLRRQSLDELPQLFNVLGGDMSVVGPRPLVVEEDRLFSGWQRERYHVRPGITGPWQILGSSRVPIDDMVTLDYLYCANWSLWLDLKIIVRTVPYVLSRRSGEY
jgi:exopolysaccharide biosynthesis polyprenyl glycosylphosphotransferase